MKIAAYLDETGSVSSFDRAGSVCLFGREDSGWVEQDRIGIDFVDQPTLAPRKAVLRDVAARLGTCRVLLLGQVTGILPAILQEELGFRLWRSEGDLADQLDSVAAREAEAAEKAAKAALSPLIPLPIAPLSLGGGCGGGSPRRRGGPAPAADILAQANSALEIVGDPAESRFRLDLAACLASGSGLNSREILIPILIGPPFRSLEILCDHPPRWLAETLAGLGMIATIDSLDAGVRVTITRRDDR
ncbi:Fe-only nitrogenase accessory protein AnfO [Magnetospirillum fulvum]|uniref:Fe-only nitrogenase accessory protein AnfO n=1 Tax=Magnetospirillum fulvum TaxID=1082 RepID=A0A1H6H7J4_MAGFU|nr:Fe-only nitrogenase accessory protein AnfO [Magnetospirillum fulvum]SEH31152.1 Fe-only nitrogenase accessory protein AnfO [Magnetospirillum fulvum]